MAMFVSKKSGWCIGADIENWQRQRQWLPVRRYVLRVSALRCLPSRRPIFLAPRRKCESRLRVRRSVKSVVDCCCCCTTCGESTGCCTLLPCRATYGRYIGTTILKLKCLYLKTAVKERSVRTAGVPSCFSARFSRTGKVLPIPNKKEAFVGKILVEILPK